MKEKHPLVNQEKPKDTNLDLQIQENLSKLEPSIDKDEENHPNSEKRKDISLEPTAPKKRYILIYSIQKT